MARSETLLLTGSFVVEMAVYGVVLAFPNPSPAAMLMVAVLLVAPALTVGCFAGRLGFIYGVVLGILPATLGLFEIPTAFLGLSPVEGGSVLLFVYVLASGLSGAAGEFASRWRNAAYHSLNRTRVRRASCGARRHAPLSFVGWASRIEPYPIESSPCISTVPATAA